LLTQKGPAKQLIA